MPDTDLARGALRARVANCGRCAYEFYSNVAVIADDELGLLDWQVPGVLCHLETFHERHAEEPSA